MFSWAEKWKGERSVFPDWLRADRVSVWLGSASKHIGIVSLHSLAGLSVDLTLIRFHIYLLQMETFLQYIILLYHKQNGLIILLNSKQERK